MQFTVRLTGTETITAAAERSAAEARRQAEERLRDRLATLTPSLPEEPSR